MKLYFSPGACSLSPHIVLREAGQPAELEKVDLATHRTASGADYYGITPKGQVPLLITDEGDRVSEGPIICQYVADRAGATTLMPAAGTPARAMVEAILAAVGGDEAPQADDMTVLVARRRTA